MTTNLTENSPTEDLVKAWHDVDDYTDRAMRPILSKLRKNNKTFARRVNTPSKLRALYIFFTKKKGVTNMAGVLVDGSEGTSVVTTSGGISQNVNEMHDIFILRSHAVNRYMERHGYDGTFEQCQEYLFANLVVNPQNLDPYTKEVVIYFNHGLFLGTFKDNRCVVNTWVKNTQLYINQRLISRNLQEKMEKFLNQ